MPPQLKHPSQRGQVTILAIMVVVILAMLAVSTVDTVTAAKDEVRASADDQQRFVLAESALDAAYQDLKDEGTGTLGSAQLPIPLGQGSFYTTATDRGDGSVTVFAVGTSQGRSRTIRARIRRNNPVFHHAIFAGNSSGDPDYVMKFGGMGSHADDINGDIFSGGGILVAGQAEITGDVRASGTVTGTAGESDQSHPGFDFAGVNWSDPSIVDVKEAFKEFGEKPKKATAPGGRAEELPESHPAHIFRLNPDDREDATDATEKDDYFLEDPYETMRTDSHDDGSDATQITIDDGSGIAERTYYIDGNLWIHNKKTLSFKLASLGATGTKVTFIVRGNITFSDSFRMEDVDKDAVGFMALKDPDVEDSGNIYLGDPAFGTISELHGYLYAENDFLDVNLDENGSKNVRLLGSMTAGNQVAIERSHINGHHSQLVVDWDRRLQTGAVTLPFLSSHLPDTNVVTWRLEAWIEAPIVPLAPLAGPSGS